jgi:hypothetical protein
MDYQANYEKAKAAGYSDAEIAQHLGGDNYSVAKEHGYSDAEILQHLTGIKVGQKESPKQEEPGMLQKMLEIEKQPGLPKSPMDFIKQTGRQFKDALTSPMPGSMLTAPFKAVSENASQAGADVARGLEHGLGKGIARGAGFVTAAALDPLSYAGGEMLKGPKPAESLPQNAMKPAVSDMIENLEKQSAGAKAAIESHTQSVMSHVDDILKKYGGELNDAKANLGIPVTNKAREAAILEHGNPHGLSPKNVPEALKDIVDKPKSPTELVKNIAKFKAAEPSIADETTKVKLASVLQDHINQTVDWTKSGDTVDGVLKSQYKELKQIGIPDSLKASKAKMAEVLDLTGELQSKLDEPGKAEAYLRNIVTSKSPKSKDALMAIRHLEELSGEKIFDKIATAVKTEKAADMSIKELKKIKPTEARPSEDAGISMQDILSHKITGWTSVIKDILKFKDQIKAGAKNIGPAMGRQGLIGAARGFTLNQSNPDAHAKLQRSLEELQRGTNAK